jgi:hypothetical protein
MKLWSRMKLKGAGINENSGVELSCRGARINVILEEGG